MGAHIDSRSKVRDIVAFLHNITDTNLESGAIIDTNSFDNGLTLVPLAAISGDIYVFSIRESEDSGMANSNAIDQKNLIGTLDDLIKTTFDPVGSTLNALGLIDVKRFIQIFGISTSGSAGVVSVYARATENEQPVVNTPVT